MLSLKKIWELVQGANLNDAHEIPVSEGVGTGKTKRYNIGQLKAFISAYILQQISGITKGDTGAQGATGAQGMQGEKGEKGDKGDTGSQGLKGDQGLQGPIGIQGPIGVKGDKGDTGAQGVQGIKGDKGDKGEQGDKGDTGADGSDGIEMFAFACSDETSDLLSSIAVITFSAPLNFNISKIYACVNAAPLGSGLIIDVLKNDISILEDKLNIDSGDLNSDSSLSPASIINGAVLKDDVLTINIDQVGAIDPGKGLKIFIIQ